MNRPAALVQPIDRTCRGTALPPSLPRIEQITWAELTAIAPGLLAYVALVLYVISLSPFWVGDGYDDAGYFLMSRNIWRYGEPVLDHTGSPLPSMTWPPAFPTVLAPLGVLPFHAAVLAERVFVGLAGAALLILAYVWLRRHVQLDRSWAAAALLCLGTAPAFLKFGAVILSDIPAALLLMAAILLLRSGRNIQAAFVLVLAYAFRTMNLAVLAAAVLWLLWRGRRREARRTALVGGIGAAAWTAVFHSPGYVSAITLSDLENPGAGRLGFVGFVGRVGHAALHLLTGGLPSVVAGIFQSRTLLTHAGPALALLSCVVLLAMVVGFKQRDLSLEALVCGALIGVTLIWPWDPARYLIPVAPLMVGAVAATLASLGKGWTMVALATATATVVGNVQQFHAVMPSRASEAQRLGGLERLYGWVGTRVGRSDIVLTYADIQCYLYSGHPATRALGAFVPGRTYVIDVPYGSVNHAGVDLDQQLLDSFAGPIVYRDGPLLIRLATAKR